MPTISMFYGIVIYMYFSDSGKHGKPHIHAEYAEYKAAFSIPEGELLSGDFPPKKIKLIEAWIEIHQEELLANWKLALNNEPVYKIKPLS